MRIRNRNVGLSRCAGNGDVRSFICNLYSFDSYVRSLHLEEGSIRLVGPNGDQTLSICKQNGNLAYIFIVKENVVSGDG